MEKPVERQYITVNKISKIPITRQVASSATFRQRLNELGANNSSQTLLDEQQVDHLRKVPDFGKLTIRSGSYIPLDIDVSVMLRQFRWHKIRMRLSVVQVHKGDLRKMLKFTISPKTAKTRSEIEDRGSLCSKTGSKMTKNCQKNEW